ncbi:MAG: Wzy polymerase domain-containing protein, partial [Aeromonas sp.]
RGLEIYQSGGVRTDIWLFSLDLISKHWLVGNGYGGFEATFLNEYAKALHLNLDIGMQIYNLDHPHNELLYWGIEGGIAPIMGMVVMGSALLWRLVKVGWVNGMALLALVTPILLHTQTEYPFYHAIALWWLLLTLIYIIDSDIAEQHVAHANGQWWDWVYRPWLLLRFIAIIIPLVVVPFMLTAIHTAWVVTKYERGGYKEPALLQRIINPMAWLTRVEIDVNTVRLKVGLQTHNAAELEAYVAWGQAFVRHTPRANIYANMVIALNGLNRHDEANALRAAALILYPTDPQLMRSAALATKPGSKLATKLATKLVSRPATMNSVSAAAAR